MTNTIQTTQQTIQQVISLIHCMDRDELIQLNNEYCQSINAYDDEVRFNDDDFLNTFFDKDLTGLARAICYGDYRYSDDLVRFNGYGNLESFNYFQAEDLCELVPTIAEYIIENSVDFSQFDEIDFNNIED
jgi:hypothetical protein